MAITINDGVRNAAANAVGPLFNSGVINIYSGTPPAVGSAATGDLLAEVTVGATAFGASAAGTITLNGVPLSDNSINLSGTAGYFRLIGGANTLQGTVSASGGGGDMIVDNVNLVQGGVFTINSATVTMPGG